MTEFAPTTPDATPDGITQWPDGNLWFTEETVSRNGSITPSGVVTEFSDGITAAAGPQAITQGPDGNLWFTGEDVNTIGRILSGVVPTRTAASRPDRDRGAGSS